MFDKKELELRPLLPEDSRSLAKIANNKNISDKLRDLFPYPYTEEDAKKFINTSLQKQPSCTFAIDFRQELCGVIGLVPQQDVYRISAELGYWIGEEYWGQGIATEAVRLISEYGFQKLGLLRVYSGVYESNKASMRVLEKNGFLKDCVFKKAIIKNDIIMNEHRYSKII